MHYDEISWVTSPKYCPFVCESPGGFISQHHNNDTFIRPLGRDSVVLKGILHITGPLCGESPCGLVSQNHNRDTCMWPLGRDSVVIMMKFLVGILHITGPLCVKSTAWLNWPIRDCCSAFLLFNICKFRHFTREIWWNPLAQRPCHITGPLCGEVTCCLASLHRQGCLCGVSLLNTLRPRQVGRYFTDNIF